MRRRFNRKEDETLTGLLCGDGEGNKNDLRSDSVWRAMGWTCDTRPNAVKDTEIRFFRREYGMHGKMHKQGM